MTVTGTTMWVNGELVPEDRATVSAHDHGLVVGDGAFEAIKVVHGQVFALNRHLARMERTVAGLGLAPIDHATVEKAVAEVISANARALTGTHDILRITYTAGPGPLGSGRENGPVTLVLGVSLQDGPRPESTTVITVPYCRNERGALTGLKTTSYAENVVALAAAQAQGASEALFPNTAGELCEGTGSNVFVVSAGQLVTPTLASGCLAGITRALVLEWTDAVERDVPMEALETADEVFLTSTGRDVQAVTAIDGRLVGDGRPGPVTRATAQAFDAGQARSLEP